MPESKKQAKKLTKTAIGKKLVAAFPELKGIKDSKKLKSHFKKAIKELSSCIELSGKKPAGKHKKPVKAKLIIDGIVPPLT